MPTNVRLYETDGTEFNEILHPETVPGQVIGLLDQTGKIDLKYMSQAVLGGAKHIGIVDTATVQSYNLFGKLLANAVSHDIKVVSGSDTSFAHKRLEEVLLGRYFQIQITDGTELLISDISNIATLDSTLKQAYRDFYGISNDTLPITITFQYDGDDGSSGLETTKALERNDYLVFNGIDYSSPSINVPVLKGLTNFTGANFGNGVQTISFSGLQFTNKNTRRLAYDRITLTMTGTGVPYPDYVTLAFGDFNATKQGTLEVLGDIGDGYPWSLSVTFYNVEAGFTQVQWDSFFTDGTGSNIKVHWGVINNTYGNATKDISGIVKFVDDTLPLDSTNTTLAMTQKATKKAVDTWGLQLTSQTTANMEALILDDSYAITPKKSFAITERFGGMRQFNTLAEANNHESKFVAGTVVAVKV